MFSIKRNNKLDHITSHSKRDFILLWLGQAVSLVGSGMTCFAQSVYVYTDLYGTIANLMIIAVLAQLPGILISPLAGVLVDRWDRKWVMIIGDSVAALAALSLRTVIMRDSFQIWHMYIIVVIISIANHFQWPAYFSTVQLMVPREQLGKANGLVQTGRSIGWIAAPLMAGVAVTYFKLEGVILFDLASYLFALTMILIVHIPKLKTRTLKPIGKHSLLRETFYGWTHIIARPSLLGLLIIFAVANFMFSCNTLLIIPLGLTLTSATILGITLSFNGISMLAGSFTMTLWGGPKRRVYGVLGFMLLQGVALIFIGFRPSIYLLLCGSAVFSFATPIINACSGTIWHTKVSPEIQGRVLAASGMVLTASSQLGFLTSGLLAEYVFIPLLSAGGPLAGNIGKILGTGKENGIGFMYIVMGMFCLVIIAVSFSYKPLRFLDKRLPDVVISDAVERQESVKPELGKILGIIDLRQQ